jgi:hypothetical protein
MEDILDPDLCNEFINLARKTQPWFKFVNPFSNKPIVKGSTTYNKILKKCQSVRFGALVKERGKKQDIAPPKTKRIKKSSPISSPQFSPSPRKRSNSLSPSDILTQKMKRITIQSPQMSPETDVGPELSLRLSQATPPPRSKFPLRARSNSPVVRLVSPGLESKKSSQATQSLSPEIISSISKKNKPKSKTPSPKSKSPSPTQYPVRVPSKKTYTPKKDISLDINKCRLLLEEAEELQDGQKMKNPFSNKMIIKGKSTFQKLVKDCQRFIRQYKEEEPKYEEFDLEDILTTDF